VLYGGKELGLLDREGRKAFRKDVQVIFQNPHGSLDPTYSVEELLEEPLKAFGEKDRLSRHQAVLEVLDQVALSRELRERRSKELSGGQCQRVAIARALISKPKVVICDEPVSALDVLVQKQILDLLVLLRKELDLSYLFISHDLGVIQAIADDVAVMGGGRIHETGTVKEVFASPRSLLTAELLDSLPRGIRSPV
jgi:peptide/nickel transport system ATP-binding protein